MNMSESTENYFTEYETDVAKIKVRFNDTSNLTREEIFKSIALASYNLCLHEYEKKMREDNE